MPRPSGQQMHVHYSQQQHYDYDPYNFHAGKNVSVSRRGHPRAIHQHPYVRPDHGCPPIYNYFDVQRMISPPYVNSAAGSPAHSNQPKAASQQQATDTKKKPPRPYTEYNIFFQLERDRILMELDDKKSKEEEPNVEAGEGSPKEMILNQPSDENDILPRPGRFAHLQLMPKWYDSAHRIAENKRNKMKRKHRKTHGLVGFLDLTKMISKAWADADEEIKEYCKRVANRQLGYYKDELKAIKRHAQQQQQQFFIEQQQAAHNMVPLPMSSLAPPPPLHYWHQQESLYPHVIHNPSSYPEKYPLTPPSQETYIEDQLYYERPSPRNVKPSGKMHPLEELMLRRRIYGGKAKSHAAWPSRLSDMDGRSGGERLPHKNSFISPKDTGTEAKEAVTPSPPRTNDPSTPPNLPMKKRLKKEESSDTSNEDSQRISGDILESCGDANNSSPFSASFPSPSEMITNMFDSSPLSASSYQRVLGPYMLSPMPYMDFSPQESVGSPRHYRPMDPSTVPSHLALPGSCAASCLRAPHHREFSGTLDEDLTEEILDFDEEEMDCMWNKLAKSAKARRNAKAAAAKELFRMNHDALQNGRTISSPGIVNALGLAHSFASPSIPTGTKLLSPGAPAVTNAPQLPSVDEEQDQENVKE